MMLHCGATEIERKDIPMIACPEKIVTRKEDKNGKMQESTWQPVEHEFLVRYTEQNLLQQGFRVTKSQFATTPLGMRFFGLMEITGKDLDGNGSNKEYSRLLGLRNSFDKSMTAGIACGARVFVCDNLSFSGEVCANHRHTKNIYDKLPGMITTAISQISEAFKFQDLRIEAYKNTAFDQFGLGDQLIRLIRTGSVPPGKVVAVHDEYLKPTHEHNTDSKVWNLFNAVTEVLKKVPAPEMSTRTQRLHVELDKVCGVKWKDITAKDRFEAERAEEMKEAGVIIDAAPQNITGGGVIIDA
jgi:hypothetical protein